MNNRVLLVFPGFTNNRRASRPPLGLLSIASLLVEKGIQVTILDETIEDDFDKKLLNELKKDPICVGISSMTVNHIIPSLRVSKLVKDNSNIPTVWGGVHPSLAPASTLKHELVDFIVMDDGEETFSVLLESLSRDCSGLDKIPGIGFKRNGEIKLNNPSLPFDIEKSPPSLFSLIDFNKYKQDGFMKYAFGLSADD